MSDDGISVVVEGEDAPAAETRSRGRSIEEIEAETLRQNDRAARLHREAALNNVNAALLTIDTESRATKSEYTAAMETGDFEAAADAQARLAATEVKRIGLQARSEALERQPRSFDEYASRFTEPTARWMREHRDWVVDPGKSTELAGAHHRAVREGMTPDTPEYFEHVEKTLGMRGGSNAGGRRMSAGDNRGQRINVDPNDVRTHIINNGKQVFLTKGERQRATDGTLVWNYDDPSGQGRFKRGDPIGLREMSRRKAAMVSEGRYDRLD